MTTETEKGADEVTGWRAVAVSLAFHLRARTAMLIRKLYYRLPGGFQRAVLVKRRQAIWLRAGIVFIHVPKAAGTSINTALYACFMGHAYASDVGRWGSPALRRLPSFAVTRNPWDRLVSAYRFAKAGFGVGGDVQAGMTNPERYKIPEFDTFEAFVTDWLAAQELSRLDGVFQPQWQFFCNGAGTPLVDHVGRVEDLGPTLDFIRNSTGKQAQIDWANRSGEASDYHDFYTPELADLVRSIYRKDIELFGYEF